MSRKLRCQVVDLVDHGSHVYSVSLKPESRVPRFSAGQFLHLALDSYKPGDFWPESRAFSIASSPGDRDMLTITYAVKGEFTTRMETELSPGREVWVKLPYGEFLINPEKDACLLAGGTGITAFSSFLSNVGSDYPHDIYVYYGARYSDLLIYRPLIEAAAKRCPKLKPFYLIEEGKAPGATSGRINLDVVWHTLPQPLSITYYLSGPPIMLKTLTYALKERGVPSDQIAIDAWE